MWFWITIGILALVALVLVGIIERDSEDGRRH